MEFNLETKSDCKISSYPDEKDHDVKNNADLIPQMDSSKVIHFL